MSTSSQFPIEDLERIESATDLRHFLSEHPLLETPQTAERLHAEILSGIVVAPERAHRLSNLVRWIAEISDDEYVLALADRCEGHVHYGAGNYSAALQCYDTAVGRFQRLGREADVARTLSGAMQSLIYLGQNDKAISYSERARLIFERERDDLRLARLDSNVGNILYRQDRYTEALNLYQLALDRLLAMNRRQDAAAVLSNMAVASTGTGEFQRAAGEYARAREIAVHENLSSLVAELDYNVAYLHFLRGDHAQALTLYREARRYSEAVRDEYHAALCDLDQAEVYLDLNLIDDSVHLSRAAASKFEELGMNYERAKALTFFGIAEHARHHTRRAVVLFAQAKRLFAQANNPVWPAIVDFYRAILLRDLGQTIPAARLAFRSQRVFEFHGLPNRRALVKLLKAEMTLAKGLLAEALEEIHSAVADLDPSDHAIVFFHAEYLRGRILRMQDKPGAAFDAFKQAAERLESVRARLAGDDLKVAFVEDKLDVYSQLMQLSREGFVSDHEASILEYIEKSKSRSLADRVAFLESNPPPQAPVSGEILTVREKLSALYREIDSRQADRRDLRNLRDRVGKLERRLGELLREQEFDQALVGNTADWTPVSLNTLVESLPSGAQVLEFFITDQHLWVGVIGKAGATFRDLGPIDPIYSVLQLLTFQLSRLQRETRESSTYGLGQAATMAHLQALYRRLIQPIEPLLDAHDLIVIPHGLLHRLPFHALHNGSSFLVDRFTVSYAPSATVFCLCQRKPTGNTNRSLLLGVPDEKSPAIATEVAAIAKLIPEPHVFVGAHATARALSDHARLSRYIHIAAHGEFRSDNPMFSSVRLGDGHVNVLDLYRLRLNAELVTLSGCSTGVGSIVGGDELVGLERGLMHAGARAVLLSLWEVHDSSTAVFMHHFYEKLGSALHCAAAVRQAMLRLKQDWPEPQYWAPFVLAGYGLRPQENFSGSIFLNEDMAP
jgi:tetratricopeptide (TPR) repeat protein